MATEWETFTERDSPPQARSYSTTSERSENKCNAVNSNATNLKLNYKNHRENTSTLKLSNSRQTINTSTVTILTILTILQSGSAYSQAEKLPSGIHKSIHKFCEYDSHICTALAHPLTHIKPKEFALPPSICSTHMRLLYTSHPIRTSPHCIPLRTPNRYTITLPSTRPRRRRCPVPGA